MSIDAAPKFTVNDLKRLAGNIEFCKKVAEALVAKAKYETIAPKIHAIYTRVFESMKPFAPDPKWSERGRVIEILDYEQMYLTEIGGPQWNAFWEASRVAIKEAGYEVEKEGYCPKAVAETESIRARNEVINAAAKIVPGLPAASDIHKPEMFNRAFDLLVGVAMQGKHGGAMRRGLAG